MKRVFFLPDCHHPYHDPRAWRVALSAIRHFSPQTIVILGDFGDFYCTSRHLKNPNRSRDLTVEISACNAALDELDRFHTPDKRFCLGNHENNLERYLSERAPELFNLVRVEDLLHLRDRGFLVTPYRAFGRIGKLAFTHEVGHCGERAHVQSADAVGANLIIGHTHRLAAYYRSTMLGKPHVAISSGWLGDAEKAEYMHRARTKDWQLGFTVGYMRDDGVMHLQPVPIINYSCVVGGRLIRG